MLYTNSPALSGFLGAALVVVVLAWASVDALHRWGLAAAGAVVLLAAGIFATMAFGQSGPADLAVPALIVFCLVCWWLIRRKKRKPTPPVPPPSEG